MGSFFSVLDKNVPDGYSLEVLWQRASNEYPQHMLLWRNKKNYPRIITKYSSLTIPLKDSDLTAHKWSLITVHAVHLKKHCIRCIDCMDEKADPGDGWVWWLCILHHWGTQLRLISVGLWLGKACYPCSRYQERGDVFISSVSSLSFLVLFLSCPSLFSTISPIIFLPFSRRWHKMTHKGW